MNAYTGKTKADYLKWRAEYRQHYSQLSDKIKKLKIGYKAEQRSLAYFGTLAELMSAQREARRCIDLRHESKVSAGQQYRDNMKA